MLHATEKNKGKLYTRYLGSRDGRESKVHEEDEITSIVLGPLDFLTPEELGRFWRSVLATTSHAEFLPDSAPDRTKIDFWERRAARDTGNPIEPDVVVRMRWPNGATRVLLIELKWRAPLSGTDQLHRQWQCYLDEVERQQALHLFIAPELSEGAHAPDNVSAGGDVWETKGKNRLVLLSWLHIRGILGELAVEPSSLGRWSRLADQFLEKLKIKKFSGFSCITSEMPIPAAPAGPIFWSSTSE